MANSLTNILPKLLASGLLNLRELAVMPRIVNSDFSAEAAQKGSSIDVPLPYALTASSVTPSETPSAPPDSTPGVVTITLDNWFKAGFHLTDKEMLQIDRNRHFMPLQVGEAIRALANKVNDTLHAEYSSVYGFVGTPATTPFASDASAATAARKVLHEQLAPRAERRAVIDFSAEANALGLATFADAEKVGSANVKIEGEIGRKYGLDWYADDAVKTHTAGTASSATTDNAGYAVGVKTVTLASAGTGTLLVGDVVTFAGDTQTYAITEGDTDVSDGGSISFEPGLKVAMSAATKAITVKATHVVNLAFHRDAFAFANRPLMDSMSGVGDLGPSLMSLQDPQTGIALRMEISRQNKQIVWEYDILWGAKLVRPELAARIAG